MKNADLILKYGIDFTKPLISLEGKTFPAHFNNKEENNNGFTAEINLDNIDIKYCVETSENGFSEQVKFKCKETDIPNDFALLHKLEKENLTFMPVPFGNHDLKPEPCFADSFDGVLNCEGGIILNGLSGIAVAKEPSDRPPVWVEFKKCDGEMYFSAASVKANRGFFDKTELGGGYVEINFHKTEYICFNGDLNDGFYSYRKYMAEKGVARPEGYNPPVNYCIYYECSRLDKVNSALNQQEIHGCHSMTDKVIEDMGEIAKSLHCNLLYLDQGWDCYFSNLIWDESRLGDTKTLTEKMRKKGLEIGLLVGLHAGDDVTDTRHYLKDENGNVIPGDPWHKYGICTCSKEYADIRVERLKKLSDAGIAFFSYDFNNFTPCYSKEHGHSLPSTVYDHAKALTDMQAKVKELCPNTLIECHDWFDAGVYFFPIYMFSSGHHERWGFEYMWHPLEDYKSGRLQNLYYYDLAYEKPLYLHMNLTGMGDNAEVFWYFASTVRHFGMGNFSELDDGKKELIKKASAVYSTVHEYLACGDFYGIDPLTHIHILKNKGAVINLFANGEKRNGPVIINLEKYGVTSARNTEILWGKARVELNGLTVTVTPEMLDSDAVTVKLY